MSLPTDALVEGLIAGEQRSLARTISAIENRTEGYRELVARLYEHADPNETAVIGVTGSPGSGKSTLVEELIAAYRARDLDVGVIAVDPSSPYSGGAVLGDRIRVSSTMDDSGVFFRSMSARGALGGLSTAATEAIRALSAFGMDVVFLETVGTGQNEIDVVRAADSVLLLVPPDAGDVVQTLKAGVLEIADIFVVNKADLDGAERTVHELEDMLRMADEGPGPDRSDGWEKPILTTVATEGEGVDSLVGAIEDHRSHLRASGGLASAATDRTAAEIRTLVEDDIEAAIAAAIDRRGGMDAIAESVLDGSADPYSAAREIIEAMDLDDALDAGGTHAARGTRRRP